MLSDPPPAELANGSIRAYFNEAGSRQDNSNTQGAQDALIERISSARSSIDAAIYGFSNRYILDALIKAHLRGVRVRVAGDARHFGTNERGYRLMQQHHIPIQVGNENHIMHDKFFVIDNLLVFAGTGNITTTGFNRNDNNWVLMEHAGVAQRFKAQFETMFAGNFSTAKRRQDASKPNTWMVGDTKVEVYFSPEDDAMGRILQEVEKVDTNIYFTIFAFTKDQIGSLFVRKHREFERSLTQEELDLPIFSTDPSKPARPKVVTGILDRSQIQGNYLYHEVYRMVSNGVPMTVDANENSYLPGDYQAGGGRLHSKTMILDRGTDHARVITGSFNWSSAATIANDEFLLILHGKEIAEQYYRTFQSLWLKSKDISVAICNYYDKTDASAIPLCPDQVKAGDVVFSEVHWAGWNGLTDATDLGGTHRKEISNDEFIELYNTTDHPIDLSLWTISNDSDFKMGFTPGTVILPHQYFLILDHNSPQYSDTSKLDMTQVAFLNPDFVVNNANDPRFPRLNLTDNQMDLRLIAPAKLADGKMKVIDRAGDGGLPFGGKVTYNGFDIVKVFSMERKIPEAAGEQVPNGILPESWKTSSGGTNNNISPQFKSKIVATPGEKNSP